MRSDCYFYGGCNDHNISDRTAAAHVRDGLVSDPGRGDVHAVIPWLGANHRVGVVPADRVAGLNAGSHQSEKII